MFYVIQDRRTDVVIHTCEAASEAEALADADREYKLARDADGPDPADFVITELSQEAFDEINAIAWRGYAGDSAPMIRAACRARA